MSRTRVRRTINAPVEKVFDTVAHIENFAEAIPHITNVEFLTESHRGTGTRFRETRVMKGREATTELEVTEYDENDKVRMVSESGGTTWDTVFRMRSEGGATELVMVMDARPNNLGARLVNPFIKKTVAKALEADLDAIKRYCETPN